MSNMPLKLRDVAAADWPAVSGAFRDLTYEQSLTYAQAAAARIGGKARFVALEPPQGAPLAAACLRLRQVPGLGRGIAWIAAGPLTSPRGQSAPSPDRLKEVLSTLRRDVHADGHILRIRLPAVVDYDADDLAARALEAGYQPTQSAPSYQTVIICLDQEEDTLMKGFHGKWRNILRKSLKSNLHLDHGPISLFSDRFRALYERVRAAKGFDPDIPPEFYYNLAGPDFDHEVLIARSGDTDVAGMTIGRTGSNAVYLFGATDIPGRNLGAGYYLMWNAMLRMRAAGVKLFDLGGIDEVGNPTVAQFKLRTGGRKIIAPGPWETSPAGATARLIKLAETAHRRLRRRS